MRSFFRLVRTGILVLGAGTLVQLSLTTTASASIRDVESNIGPHAAQRGEEVKAKRVVVAVGSPQLVLLDAALLNPRGFFDRPAESETFPSALREAAIERIETFGEKVEARMPQPGSASALLATFALVAFFFARRLTR